MTQEALKLALEALETADETDFWNKQKQAITAIKEALAEHAMRETQRLGQEIEQEPVAWMWNNHGSIALSRFQKVGWQPLYTTPPQRTWVGLADEDLYVVAEEESCSFIAGAKWSEEILKGKNT